MDWDKIIEMRDELDARRKAAFHRLDRMDSDDPEFQAALIDAAEARGALAGFDKLANMLYKAQDAPRPGDWE